MTPTELLPQRFTEASASLIQAHGPVQLARAISREAGPILILEDHPWLRAAAAHFPEDFAGEIQFISETGLPAPHTVATAVTIGLGAVPATGSVLISGRSAPAFRMSLCPRRHVVIIPADQSSLTMARALELTARDPSGLISWLTGPSRTADIEKVLVLGAQGASELVIIIYHQD